MENHFLEYNDTLNRIKEVKAKLREVKLSKYSVKGVSYDGLPKGTASNDIMVDIMAREQELEEELKELEEKKDVLYKKHCEEINKVMNDVYISILRQWFLDKFNISEIAYTLGKSESHIKRLKRKAIKEFICKNDTK